MSVELDESSILRIGDTIGIRLRDHYFEQVIESLQVDHNPSNEVRGPCRAGIATSLRKTDLKLGELVYLRNMTDENVPGPTTNAPSG